MRAYWWRIAAVIGVVLAMLTGGTASGAGAPASILLSGVDLHDGTFYKVGATYYWVGTQYGCGFHWNSATNSQFCGFAVSTSASLSGPWSQPQTILSPTQTDTWNGQSWNAECAQYGCFNPRMVQRGDGVWILWFNASGDYKTTKANAFYALGCNGPAGPCGVEAGAPNGSTNKPSLAYCKQDGDFSIVQDATGAAILCTRSGDSHSLAIEHLDRWWVSGNGSGSLALAGLTHVEGPGAAALPDGTWVMTYSDSNCAYCNGTGTGYATAPTMMGPWTTEPSSQGPLSARRGLSVASCGGQPRTVTVVDGQAWQLVDLWGVWNGDFTNQTGAGSVLLPLSQTPGSDVNGGVWSPPFTLGACPA